MVNTQTNSKNNLPRTAILIDGEWLEIAARHIKLEVDYFKLFHYFKELFGAYTAIYYFIGVFSDDRNNQFVQTLKTIGYDIELSRLTRIAQGNQVRTISKGLEVRLALRLASLPPDFDRIVLISGDNDFVPVLVHAKEAGRSATLIALPIVTGRDIISSVDIFINLEQIIKQSMYISPEKTHEDKHISPIPDDIYIEKGKHFQPYLTLRNIFLQTKRELTIIDSHIDEQILHLISLLPLDINVRVFTDRIHAPDFCLMVKKYVVKAARYEYTKQKNFTTDTSALIMNGGIVGIRSKI